ncbi:hypothetical protein RKD20_000313 [Streptomyces sp. SLBN-8D4]|jgi:hypothetical protein
MFREALPAWLGRSTARQRHPRAAPPRPTPRRPSDTFAGSHKASVRAGAGSSRWSSRRFGSLGDRGGASRAAVGAGGIRRGPQPHHQRFPGRQLRVSPTISASCTPERTGPPHQCGLRRAPPAQLTYRREDPRERWVAARGRSVMVQPVPYWLTSVRTHIPEIVASLPGRRRPRKLGVAPPRLQPPVLRAYRVAWASGLPGLQGCDDGRMRPGTERTRHTSPHRDFQRAPRARELRRGVNRRPTPERWPVGGSSTPDRPPPRPPQAPPGIDRLVLRDSEALTIWA